MKVAVIGAGAAGVSAAWRARRAGLEVTLFHDRPGATALYSGALDVAPWTELRPGVPLDADVLAFATALGIWNIGAAEAVVATEAGVVRPARGIDSALLDLAALRGKVIALPDLDVVGWDARWLAGALQGSDWARAASCRFVAVPVADPWGAGPRTAEHVSELHDDPSRVAQFVDRLQRAAAPCDAWLLGPWLGSVPGSADVVRERLGLPCGEILSGPGGPAGSRFERARDELLGASGSSIHRARVERVEPTRGGLKLTATPEAGGALASTFEKVFLCLGGVVSGGVLLRDGGNVSGPSQSSFALSVEAGALLSADGIEVDRASSLHGYDVHARGLHVLERIGVKTAGALLLGHELLYAAGDVVADRPRTVLEAVRAGIAAAREALRREERAER